MDKLVERVRAEQDPDRRARLLCAIIVSRRQERLPWYDGKRNDTLNMARKYLAQIAPGRLEQFEHKLAVFRSAPQFAMCYRQQFLPEAVLADLMAFLAQLPPDKLRDTELEMLGRYKLNNLKAFIPAREVAQAWLEQSIGHPVRPTYSLFVRYVAGGRLPVHLDSFDSQYCIGICLNRSASWPIRLSNMFPAPHEDALAGWSEQAVLDDPGLTWTTLDPEPNDAYIFAPAHQWHWRAPIGPDHASPYDMLYFSFVDPDAYDLLYPKSWAAGFGIPELAELGEVLMLTDRQTSDQAKP